MPTPDATFAAVLSAYIATLPDGRLRELCRMVAREMERARAGNNHASENSL